MEPLSLREWSRIIASAVLGGIGLWVFVFLCFLFGQVYETASIKTVEAGHSGEHFFKNDRYHVWWASEANMESQKKVLASRNTRQYKWDIMVNHYGVHLSIRTDSNMKKALLQVARKKYLTLTQVILEALREKLEAENKKEKT